MSGKKRVGSDNAIENLLSRTIQAVISCDGPHPFMSKRHQQVKGPKTLPSNDRNLAVARLTASWNPDTQELEPKDFGPGPHTLRLRKHVREKIEAKGWTQDDDLVLTIWPAWYSPLEEAHALPDFQMERPLVANAFLESDWPTSERNLTSEAWIRGALWARFDDGFEVVMKPSGTREARFIRILGALDPTISPGDPIMVEATWIRELGFAFRLERAWGGWWMRVTKKIRRKRARKRARA